MFIRKFFPKDLDSINRLARTEPDYNIPHHVLDHENVILALENEKVMGIAAFERNDLHDRVIVEYVWVHPSFRQNGVGSSLHRQLLNEFPPEKKYLAIDISCYQEQRSSQLFIESLGFKKYLDSYMHTLNFREISRVFDENQIIPLAELYKIPNMKKKVRDFYIRRYSEEHEKHVPVTNNMKVWDGYYPDNESHKFGAAMIKDSEVLACSFALLNFGERLSFETKDIVCLNGYSSGSSINEEAHNLQAVYSYQAELLNSSNRTNYYIEVDSTEKIFKKMCEWLPNSRKILQRYQRRPIGRPGKPEACTLG